MSTGQGQGRENPGAELYERHPAAGRPPRLPEPHPHADTGVMMSDACIRRISRSLSIGLFVVFYWFSVQKFAPHVSPAEEVAGRTVEALTLHLLPQRVGLLLLACWELMLGAAILFFRRSRLVLYTTFAHLALTFTTFVVFPDLTLGVTAGSLTLLGQYIVKNLVLLAGLHTLIELDGMQRRAEAAEAAFFPSSGPGTGQW